LGIAEDNLHRVTLTSFQGDYWSEDKTFENAEVGDVFHAVDMDLFNTKQPRRNTPNCYNAADHVGPNHAKARFFVVTAKHYHPEKTTVRMKAIYTWNSVPV
jgi:hypothetical protein